MFPQDQKQYALERLRKLAGGEVSSIEEINALTIDNMDGFEIIANRKDDEGKPELVYQAMVFDSGGDYFLVVGQTTEDFEVNLEAFKRIARTVRRK